METLSSRRRLHVQMYIRCMKTWNDRARALRVVANEFDERDSDIATSVRMAKAAGLKCSDFDCTAEELVAK